jgi:hypothetical protein
MVKAPLLNSRIGRVTVEDFDLKEPVGLFLKEPPPLVHYWIVVDGKGNIRPVGLEEVLIDVGAEAEGFECGFEALHGILLLGMVEAFVTDASDGQHHTQIADLGQRRRLVPEPVQIDVVA